jgi:hypothetical protein
MADRLVHAGRAYYCYCTPDAIQAKRQAAEAAGGGFTYDRTCRTRAPEEVAALEAAGTPRAVRFRVPDGQTAFVDGVRGRIVFENANIEDFVILRSDRQPTYHLSVVADDVEMAISHVIRGDDHISNTPKQILLYEALGHPVPTFAHVPLILGPDRKRLSKRHGATSVTEYQKSGYLPEAMVNFLALLGWSPGDDRELFTRDELVQAFSLDGISGGHAVFNADKLDWMNQQYIMGCRSRRSRIGSSRCSARRDCGRTRSPATGARGFSGSWHSTSRGCGGSSPSPRTPGRSSPVTLPSSATRTRRRSTCGSPELERPVAELRRAAGRAAFARRQGPGRGDHARGGRRAGREGGGADAGRPCGRDRPYRQPRPLRRPRAARPRSRPGPPGLTRRYLGRLRCALPRHGKRVLNRDRGPAG